MHWVASRFSIRTCCSLLWRRSNPAIHLIHLESGVSLLPQLLGRALGLSPLDPSDCSSAMHHAVGFVR